MMKKWFLLFLSIGLLSSMQSYAQDKNEKPAAIIFTAGWSYADIRQGDESTDNRNGFYIGLRKDVKLFPTIHLETGALYVQKGATLNMGVDNTDLEYELDYIDIPAALKFKFGGLYALGGVSGNIRVNSEINGMKTNETENFPDVRAFSLSSTLGLGMKFLMFSVDARWNHTLGDILVDNDGDDVYNSYFLIGLSYNFRRK
jgi:hypothetical protein